MSGSVLVDANVLLDILTPGERYPLNQPAKVPDCREQVALMSSFTVLQEV